MDEIVLIHRKKGERQAPLREALDKSLGWLHAETCLRELSFGLKSWLGQIKVPESTEIYSGPDAYRFSLQMATGLFSPILGETEVFGQFRAFFSEENTKDLSWKGLADHFSQQIFADVKALRQAHLVGLGSQSYGSFARKFVQTREPVLVVGGGQLAQEIIPWVSKKSKFPVQVLVRRQEQRDELLKTFPQIEAYLWDEYCGDARSLIIAAPVEGAKMLDWMKRHEIKPSRILDLREESRTDSLAKYTSRYCDLQEVFHDMEKTKAKLKPLVDTLISEIEKRVHEQATKASYRPFGWDDLCA